MHICKYLVYILYIYVCVQLYYILCLFFGDEHLCQSRPDCFGIRREWPHHWCGAGSDQHWSLDWNSIFSQKKIPLFKKRLNVMLVCAAWTQAIIPSTSPERLTKKFAGSVWTGQSTAGRNIWSTLHLLRNSCLVLQKTVCWKKVGHIYGSLMNSFELMLES